MPGSGDSELILNRVDLPGESRVVDDSKLDPGRHEEMMGRAGALFLGGGTGNHSERGLSGVDKDY
jgi:hypothetical protein